MLLTDNPYQADIGARCAVNTFLASSAGCVSALVVKCLQHYRTHGTLAFDLVAAMNGTLTGLVSVSLALLTIAGECQEERMLTNLALPPNPSVDRLLPVVQPSSYGQPFWLVW